MTEENYEYRTSQLMLRNSFRGDGKWEIPIIPKFQIHDGDFDDLLLLGLIGQKQMMKSIGIEWFTFSYTTTNLSLCGNSLTLMSRNCQGTVQFCRRTSVCT